MADQPPILPILRVKTSGLAIWSLVLGCLGLVLLLVCVGPLFSIPAVICGHLASSRIKRSGGRLTGQGLALGGLITGYVSIGLAIATIPFIANVGVPKFVKVRPTEQPNSCLNNLKMIDRAKQSWALEKQKTGEDVPTAEDLGPYLGKSFDSLKCPLAGTYSINKVSESPSCSNPAHHLPASASAR